MITLTDLFCGAGGSSTGATQVPGVEVLLAANHWPLAVETHNANLRLAGNAVTPPAARDLITAVAESLGQEVMYPGAPANHCPVVTPIPSEARYYNEEEASA
jgi:hypothetical protein